jgi:hypothetical protein
LSKRIIRVNKLSACDIITTVFRSISIMYVVMYLYVVMYYVCYVCDNNHLSVIITVIMLVVRHSRKCYYSLVLLCIVSIIIFYQHVCVE